MRDAPGDFMPGLGFLGAQQFAGVFEHHHEALSGRGLRRERRNGQSQMQDLPGGWRSTWLAAKPVRRARFIR